jgi:hypothetical protein
MRKCVLAMVFAGLAAFDPAILAGQTAGSTSRPSSSSPPRTADGHPDLQGIWDVSTITPMERPKGLPAVLNDEEARRLEGQESTRVANAARPSDPARSAPPVGASVGTYNNFWIDRGSSVVVVNGERRSALIVDPPDGRIPAVTPEAQARNALRRGTAVLPTSDAIENTANSQYDSHELRPLAERCLIGFGSTSGPPTLPNYGYNNLKQIVQTKDHVMILNEMVHDVRVIRLNQPHLPPSIRLWFGDSVGRWEGDTLVVDTTNFNDKTRFRGSSEKLHVVERFRRAADGSILYQFTIEDPATWVRPWTGEYSWMPSGAMMHEYACHEGNYSFEGILRGARLLEKEGTAAPR